MLLYRLGRDRHKDTILSGIGGEYAAGRWHVLGERIIYASPTRSLSLLEKLVHIEERVDLPSNLVFFTLEIPDSIQAENVPRKALGKYWNNVPYSPHTQSVFERFNKEKKSILMKVPSAIIKEEFNYILNPRHPDINLVKIKDLTPFNLDERL